MDEEKKIPVESASNQGITVQAARDVKIDGDVVDGNKIIKGDEVHGDKHVHGDEVRGDKYVVVQDGKNKRDPQPRIFSPAWWPWVRRNPKWLFFNICVLVVSLVTLSACAGVPTVEGWKPISEQNLGNGKRITRIDDTLFVMTETTGKCQDPRDAALWKSTDGGVHWDSVYISDLEFQGNNKCDRSSIIALAASPITPQRLYAATKDVGLLYSQDNGENWQVLNKDPERERLSGFAVLANPERLYVVGQSSAHGLYTSTDGVTWTRLDGNDLCRQESFVSLPTSATVNGLLMAEEGYLYVAPTDSSQTPLAEADIYYSGDGGICWKRVHATGTRQTVTALGVYPGSNSKILFATWNFGGWLGLGRSVWRWQWGAERETPLGELGLGTQQLYADAVNGYWYASMPFGFVMRGRLGTASNPEMLAMPFSVFSAFTSDFEPGPPLLLRNGRVYRRGTVGWWQGIFP